MKLKVALIFALAVVFLLITPLVSGAAGGVKLSAVSNKNQFSVGEEAKISIVVDAGEYSQTLTALWLGIRIADPTILEPQDSEPVTNGEYYRVGMQSYSNGLINTLIYIDPDNKPSNRSGLVGTLALRALKTGQTTVSFDSLQATESGNEFDFVEATGTTLNLKVAAAGTALTSALTSTAVSFATSTPVAATSTKTATSVATSAETGPALVVALAAAGGGLSLAAYRFVRSRKKRALGKLINDS